MSPETHHGEEPPGQASADYAGLLDAARAEAVDSPEAAAKSQLFERLGELSATVPELADRREAIETQASTLIDRYQLQAELFNSSERTLVFAGLAERASRAEAAANPTAEAAFIDNVMVALAHDYSQQLGDRWRQSEPEVAVSDSETLRVYDKYTDHQLSERLTQAIAAGRLDAVKHRLQLDAALPDSVEIRVLTISNDTVSHGLVPPRFPEDLPKQGDELFKVLNDYDETRRDFKAWNKGLEQRTSDFASELGQEKIFAGAWVSRMEGKTLLCLASPLAEKILDPEVTANANYYDDAASIRDFAILEHEFTHTQGGLSLDDNVHLGINLEELRAEHFSGNKQGYQEIKGFFTDYQTLTGQSIPKLFDELPKGGSATEIYSALANEVGLNGLTEILLCSPKNYLSDQSNPHLKAAFDHLGGYDGVLRRIDANVTDREGIETRLQRRVDAVNEVIATRTDDDFKPDAAGLLGWRRGYGLNYITDKVSDKLQAQAGSGPEL